MSLYSESVANAIISPPVGYGGQKQRPVAVLVQVHSTIPTPHGPVVAGELVIGHYYGPGEATPAEIGFSFKKLGRGIGRGLKKGVKLTGKAAKLAVKYHPLTLAAKGGFKIAKFTGKHVVKGTKKAVKWAKKNPLAVAAIATGPLGIAAYGTIKASKGLKRALSSKRKGRSVPALGPMTNEGLPATTATSNLALSSSDVPTSTLLSPQGQADAASLDAEEDSAALAQPESYPGEQQNDGQDDNSGPPDVMSADSDEGDDSPSDDGDNNDDGGSNDDEESEVSGMARDEEWVGLDDIAGGDDEWVGADEIGAVARQRAGAGPNAALVRKKGFSKKRRQPLGFNSSGTVAAGASVTIPVVAQTLFRGRKLVVPAAIMASFTIDDIKVGNVSQFAASGSQSAEAFGPTTTGEDNVQMDTCSPGLTIFMSVTNTSGGALQFRATLFGDSIQ